MITRVGILFYHLKMLFYLAVISYLNGTPLFMSEEVNP